MFVGFTTGGQVFGMNGNLNFTFFMPKGRPNMDVFNPGIIWTAGAVVVSLQSGGGMSPGDVGVVTSIGFSAG
jgi:hypothetical protein